MPLHKQEHRSPERRGTVDLESGKTVEINAHLERRPVEPKGKQRK